MGPPEGNKGFDSEEVEKSGGVVKAMEGLVTEIMRLCMVVVGC